eukprot:TRINITY_DN3579_c0_g1_i11.p1 TRINITY_DN3579_c0_g1~~TRINITY_DN3579_c0_g1_i11.p1  ORF type:complete len:247 (+),score=57.00 TRINITY_DN3579_c0_g1_i11:273-1013(+)
MTNRMMDEFGKLRNRESDSEVAMCLCTATDLQGSRYTRDCPSVFVLARIQQYARASLQTLLKIVDTPASVSSTANFLRVFKTPLQHFDLFVELKRELIASTHRALFPIFFSDNESDEEKEESKAKRPRFKMPPGALPAASDLGGQHLLIGFDFVGMFVEKLRALYEQTGLCHIFYDALAPNVVAIAFRPSKFLPSQFAVTQAAQIMPISSAEQEGEFVVPNIFQIMADIKRIGDGIVQGIHFSAST